MANLTEEEFSKHLNSRFLFSSNAEATPVELQLVQVKSYAKKDEETQRMERFSAFFEGPANNSLPQLTYRVAHEQMGEFDLFIVPIGKSENGFRYEAVFNYFKSDGEER
jgi:hypothetical protein